jgi:hypothetical protein
MVVGKENQLDRPGVDQSAQVVDVFVARVHDHAAERARGVEHPAVGTFQRHRRRVVLQQHRSDR